MSLRIGTGLLVTVLAGTGPGLAPAAPTGAVSATAPSAGADGVVRLGGVRVHLRHGTRQVVTVNHRHGWRATVGLWHRVGGEWRWGLSVRDGRTGYGGLVPGPDREQGTGTTPLGSYRLTESFGLAHRPRGSALPFHRVRAGDYWVQDNRSRWYNTLRNKRQGGFRWRLDGYNGSERLRDYPGQYRWWSSSTTTAPTPFGTGGPASSCTSTVTGRRPVACRRRSGSSARRCGGSTLTSGQSSPSDADAAGHIVGVA